jgi:hypothetical protein
MYKRYPYTNKNNQSDASCLSLFLSHNTASEINVLSSSVDKSVRSIKHIKKLFKYLYIAENNFQKKMNSDFLINTHFYFDSFSYVANEIVEYHV